MAHRKSHPNRPAREWVGGMAAFPGYIENDGEPYRPRLAIWVELPEFVIVGFAVSSPEEGDGTFASALQMALNTPLIGPPRRPPRIRVADRELAHEVRGVLGLSVPIVLGPTPEIDRVADDFARHDTPNDEAITYTRDGHLPTALLEELFVAAHALHVAAPWADAGKLGPIRLDIPALGVAGAAVSLLGALKQVEGFMILPSLEALDSLMRATAEPPSDTMGAGTRWHSLIYRPATEIPSGMRTETMANGWPVDGPDAYPVPAYHDRDGMHLPLTEKDLRIITACAAALAEFARRHASLFDGAATDTVTDSITDGDIEVRFTYPNEAAGHVPDEPGGAEHYDEAPARTPVGRLDDRVSRSLVAYAAVRWGDRPIEFRRVFKDPVEAENLATTWGIYDFEVDGETLPEAFIAAGHASRLDRRERAWLDAQIRAHLSIFEVVSRDPGHSMTLRDLLTGDTRHVMEKSGSESVRTRAVLLGRVVDFDGASYLFGVHPYTLPPRIAMHVVARVQKYLRRKHNIGPSDLRPTRVGRYMIKRWDEAAEDAMEAVMAPRVHQNTDGDPLLFVTDTFAVRRADRPKVEAELSALASAEPGTPGSYEFFREGQLPLGRTLIGQAAFAAEELVVQSNSLARADALRGLLETACGGMVVHRHRREETLEELTAALEASADTGGGVGGLGPGSIIDEEYEPDAAALAEATRAFKARHYADWADHPLPALGGATPREAMRTAKGREALDLLLREMEHMEEGEPPASRYDFKGLRAELGLPPV